jgi:hypothetical protein
MATTRANIFIGYDPRPAEVQSFAVARNSIRRQMCRIRAPIHALILRHLQRTGLYTRPHDMRLKNGHPVMWDAISNAPMSTEFAVSRFLVPAIADTGFALFVDGDVMARDDLSFLFRQADPSKACMVVKHPSYQPASNTKMDAQVQTAYPRKNWSSVVLWNCDHPSTRKLTPHLVNTAKGLWLHQLSWLDDSEIGELDPRWNWLVGYSDPSINAGLVHFTDGVPSMPGYEGVTYADDWRRELEIWAGPTEPATVNP